MNECEGCIHDKKHPDMLEVMEYCNHCKRAYAGEDRNYNSRSKQWTKYGYTFCRTVKGRWRE